MKKLALDLESLAVDTFETTPELLRAEGGTVHAHSLVRTQPKQVETGESCDGLCGGTGAYTCEATEYACVEPTGSCYGYTCYGESCGPAGSCTVGGSF